MPKAVLISIKPKYCKVISNGRKTIEIRKTRPKLKPPFKCYIYCTKSNNELIKGDISTTVGYVAKNSGKVIGEFVCDEIFSISVTYSDPNNHLAQREFPFTGGLTDKEIMDYLGNGKTGYAWHISEYQIYDKPKELGMFRTPRLRKCDADCHSELRYCNGCLGHPGYVDEHLTRPPQSWCYVNEVLNNDIR